jgi:hypothetical protein
VCPIHGREVPVEAPRYLRGHYSRLHPRQCVARIAGVVRSRERGSSPDTAGRRWNRPCVPGRPIGPWSRTPPARSSATRDQNPDTHEIAHGTRDKTPGRASTGWDGPAAAAQLEGLVKARRTPASTPRGQFRSRWGNPWGFESPLAHPLTSGIALHLLSPLGAFRPVSTGRAGSCLWTEGDG